jgi:hypothetical protein
MSRVTLELPSDTERKLREKARLSGQTLETYLQALAEQAAANDVGPASAVGIAQWEGTVLGNLSRRELYDDVD